jgi:queuine tRNA-ribosyltransferase
MVSGFYHGRLQQKQLYLKPTGMQYNHAVDRITKVTIKETTYALPIYLPDATLGVIKSLGGHDLAQTDGVVVNTYHLVETPGKEVLQKFGGIKKFMSFPGLVVSDSGGWQIYSLIHKKNAADSTKPQGKITDEGVIFYAQNRKKIFTPEDSIRMQFEIGSDIIICLDHFSDPRSSQQELQTSVNRTVLWAKRSKEEYEKQIEKRKLDDSTRPHLLAVVQGHNDKSLRKQCAEQLVQIGFDAYGYGGYPMDAQGKFDYEIARYTSELLPTDCIKFALGVGTPWQIAALYEFGWNMFDCTLPTRNARHKLLYTFKEKPTTIEQLKDPTFYEMVNINRGVYKQDTTPISNFCECETCKNHSKAYIHHLFKIGELSAYRLATLHNLQVYGDVIEVLKTAY